MKPLKQTIASCATNAQKLEGLLSSGLPETEAKLLRKQLESLNAEADSLELRLRELVNRYVSTECPAKQLLWERKLLDLTLRNNLLNMRYGKTVIPLFPNTDLEFTDIGSFEDELDSGKEFVLDQKELKEIYRNARTNMEETGANTLFVTLGSVRWNEVSNGKIYASPILLVPVELVHIKGNRYAFRKREDETRLNITLIEFLKQRYGILVEGVQPLPQDVQGVDVNMVLHQVRMAVQEHPQWQVDEDAALGIFSFTRFVLWNDVHSHFQEMNANPLVKSLVEGRLLLQDVDTFLSGKEIDQNLKPYTIAMPLDGDSAQLMAVADSCNGRSFCLYGPPGTGKSQSITNMIANGLYHNKRILFVAQKRAALEVVERRLDRIGLGQFSLEMHSNKANKKSFLAQLQSVIEHVDDEGVVNYHEQAEALYAQRLSIHDFIMAMHQQRPVGCSLYSCIDRFIAIEGEYVVLEKDFVKEHDKEAMEKLCDQLMLLESGGKKLAVPMEEYPLRDLIPAAPSGTDQHLSAYGMNKRLEDVLPTLPKLLENVQRQLQSALNMKYSHRTPRQILENDYGWKKFLQLAEIDDRLYDNIELLIEAVNRWNSHLDLLPQWKQYTANFSELRQAGLGEAVEIFLQTASGERAANAFKKGYYYNAAINIIEKDVALKEFNGAAMEQLIVKYNDAVKAYQELTRQYLHIVMMQRVDEVCKNPELNAELTLLRKRIATKGKGTSIRNIIGQMPHLIPVLCPCLLMSPLSVAQFIGMDGDKFDMVIFDEASQLPTCEAVGSIARAKAAIVVGDPKQMPPTSFFSTDVSDQESPDSNDLESILDDCISLSMPSRQLNWHYRSNNEGLIAFSNKSFYDNQLVTFPSADEMVAHVQFHYVDGVYDFGKTRTNRNEAEAVVDEVIRRMEKDGLKRSIGVVSFNKNQANLIEDILNERFADRTDLMQLNQQAEEPIFIKNLENVQGDERDIILFSVGYGPDETGHVSMNFGPLNQVGGERRLNVAVSRSRYEMHIFSSLKPEQIDLRRTNAEGAAGLRRFLEYAKDGHSEWLVKKGQTQVDNVVLQLAHRLEQCGYEVKTEIGTSAFKVDLGIVDPKNPDSFILGILCDGRRYKDLDTVDDMEITCPRVLKRLGWNIIHVWSLDWFTNMEAVVRTILDRIKEL